MSIDVLAYPQTPYRQSLIAWPVVIFNPPTQKPASVQLSFDWLVYFALMNSAPNIAVEVDINSGGTSQGSVIDKIVSCKIDNSNSTVPILVNFPDSGDTVSCPPQTIVTLPVTTNGTRCFVIAQGLTVGFLPKTLVTLYNYFIPPSIDPQLQLVYPQSIGSPTIQRNQNQILTPGFGSPALGDQSQQYFLDLQNVGSTPILGTPRASGFIYLTTVDVRLSMVGGSSIFPSLFIESTGSSGVLYQIRYLASNQVQGAPNWPIFTMSGLQLKIDATQQWQLRTTLSVPTGSAAFIQATFSFSTNDK